MNQRTTFYSLRQIFLWCSAVPMLAACPGSAAGGPGLEAGVAMCDITPTKPVTLAGYDSRKDLSQGIHDPLSARAIVFKCGEQRLALITTDTIGFYNGTAEAFRETLMAACQLKPGELFLCGTHTHSGPSPSLHPEKGHSNNVEYTKGLQGQLVELARTALNRMAPVQAGYGAGSSPVGANRREAYTDKAGHRKIKLGRNPTAMTDREVQVMKLTRTGQSEPLAVLFAYATHSTCLGPRNYLISGDVHGLAAQFVEKYLGGGTVAPNFAGASGNIDPWFRVLPSFNTNNGWIPEPVLLGTLLGEEVVRVAATIQATQAWGSVSGMIRTLELPSKPRGENAASATNSGYAPFHVTVGRVGDIALVGLGGEVFNEIGQAIKAASPFPHTIVFTHCNGTAGYVPTRESYAEDGYEITTSPFAPGADELIKQETVKMLQELRSGN